MNHYCARELQKDGQGTGLWHYTCKNGAGTMAVGYCSPWEMCAKCKDDPVKMYDTSRKDDCDVCHGKRLLPKAEPCPGHATEAGACLHYREYLLDHAKFLGPKKDKWPKHKCEVVGCDTEATHCASVSYWRTHELCEAHANRESLAALVNPGWSDWL